MSRFTEAVKISARRIFAAISRFPLTVVCLIGAAGLICYMISLHDEPALVIQKFMFTFLLGSFLGIAAQFSCERFERLQKMRVTVYMAAVLLTGGYYLILSPAPEISLQVTTRTFVAVFAMFCAFLWVPAFRSKVDFNEIALVHFKSFFTAVLYSGVLSAGCASIIAAIDVLLFSVDNDVYGYTMTIIWVVFATLYYLSLLPHFNSDQAADREYTEQSVHYPRFLEILVSYIAVPLVAAYTLVLVAYFLKILFTLNWPSGQLGGMVLAYSAAGLLIYVLASLPQNRFVVLYRLIFPKMLIPIVIMQLISVAIRLNAYAVTESRYYVVLFGIFSLVCGVMLSLKPVSRNSMIALLAAAFAIFSVLPPVDAFTVSRVTQINRLENMLEQEGVLVKGQLNPKEDVSLNRKLETTSIVEYLNWRGYLPYVTWMPDDFKPYEDMKSTFGFEAAYSNDMGSRYFYGSLDMQQPLDIAGYDTLINVNSYRYMSTDEPAIDFEVRGVKYQLLLKRLSPQEVRVEIADESGNELIGTGLYEFTKSLPVIGERPKDLLAPEMMTFDVENNGYRLRIIFQNLNITYNGSDAGVDYSLFIFFGSPR